MDIKLNILLLLTTLAGSSLAQGKESCAAEIKIGASSPKIQVAEDALLKGLTEVAETINGEVRLIMTEISHGLFTNTTKGESIANAAEKVSLDAFLVGIPPTLEAIAIFQTKLDILGKVESLKVLLQRLNEIIWLAVGSDRYPEDYTESQAEIANFATSVQVAARAAIDGLIDVMLKGTAVIPEKAKAAIACLRPRATSQFLTAVVGIFDQLNIVLEATYKAKHPTDYKNYSTRIATAQKGVLQSLRLVVVYTFSILRNLLSK